MASLTVNIPPVKAAEREVLDGLVHDLLNDYFEMKQDQQTRKKLDASKSYRSLVDRLAKIA